MIWSALHGDMQLTQGQNIPSRGEVGVKARSMFVASEGMDLIVADLGQAELRMLAHYSQDEALMLAFEEGRDLHIVTGAAFGRKTYEELKEGVDAGEQWAKDLRSLGKTGNFALTYGMGPTKFQRYLLVNNKYEVTVQQAAEWIDSYNQMYEGATEWKRRVINFVRRHGYVQTYKKRKRRLVGAMSGNQMIRGRAERQAVNAVIQGSVGDVMSESMPYVQSAIVPLGGHLLLQVHDELVAEAPKETSSLCARLMEELMVGLCNPHLRVPQVAQAHIAHSWGEAK